MSPRFLHLKFQGPREQLTAAVERCRLAHGIVALSFSNLNPSSRAALGNLSPSEILAVSQIAFFFFVEDHVIHASSRCRAI
jgi:hypothetical protein